MTTMADTKIREIFRRVTPAVDFMSLRYHRDADDTVHVRQDVLQPLRTSRDEGVMVTVHDKGGIGYGATSDLTESGVKAAVASARQWAARSAGLAVCDFSKLQMPHPRGEFRSPVRRDWESMPLAEKIERLMRLSRSMKPAGLGKAAEKIVDWSVYLWRSRSERLYLTSGGGEVYQDFDRLVPMLSVTASDAADAQTRTFGGMAWARQQGLELLDEAQYYDKGETLAREALELLAAPNCPAGKMDLLLDPDQMVLQIHESIGHPLELDRILGDERNYAGTSFVTPDMFGTFQYGSPLLNVTFDPTRPEQTASFAYDDEGLKAEKQYLIKDGKLLRPLGGFVSQQRSGMSGVANTRADSWRRPPIDRMANINLEPGGSRLEDMIAGVEHGIYMRTNCSWSIDDSRNKFQFGCEWARLIEDGRLTKVVKKPNYRGISASFWRSLTAVGGDDSFAVLGTPYCGKGEPNQAVFVGHATPACLFAGVDVFGGS
jgi:predicted Zn-dependent protease